MSNNRIQEQILRARSLIAAKTAILSADPMDGAGTELLQNCNEVFANARKANETQTMPAASMKKSVRIGSSKLAPIQKEEMDLPAPKKPTLAYSSVVTGSETNKPKLKYAGPSSLNTAQGEMKKAILRSTRPVAVTDSQKVSTTSWRQASSHNKPIAPPTEEAEGIRPNGNLRRVGSHAVTISANTSESFSMNSSKITIPTIIDPNLAGGKHACWNPESHAEKELNLLMRYKKLEDPLPLPIKKDKPTGVAGMLLTAQAPSVTATDESKSAVADNESISVIPKFVPYKPGAVPADPADDMADPDDLFARLERLRAIAERLAGQFNSSQVEENSQSPSTNMSMGVHFSQTHESRNLSSVLSQSRLMTESTVGGRQIAGGGANEQGAQRGQQKSFKLTTHRKPDLSVSSVKPASEVVYTDSELGLDPDLMYFERTPAHLTTGAVQKCEEFKRKLKAAKERLTVIQAMKVEGFEPLQGEDVYLLDQDEIEELEGEDEDYLSRPTGDTENRDEDEGDFYLKYSGDLNSYLSDTSGNPRAESEMGPNQEPNDHQRVLSINSAQVKHD